MPYINQIDNGQGNETETVLNNINTMGFREGKYYARVREGQSYPDL